MGVLKLTNLTTGYGNAPILENVNVDIQEGEIVGIIGPNGAGKSTVLKTIMGYLDPWSGNITFKGKEIGGIQPATLVKRGIGYVPQHKNIFPNMTVLENLHMGAFTINDSKFETRIETLFELFPELKNRRSQQVGTMSGGESQMVALARALILEPELVLVDEPSAGLMPKYIDDTFNKIREIRSETGVSFFIVEQKIEKLLKNSDRTYVLRNGKVRLNEKSENLINNDELEKIYLGGSDTA